MGTLTFHRYRENRRISTIRFQTLKYTQGNYVRHFWGTTPATPAARTSCTPLRQQEACGNTPAWRALHPLRGTTPVTGRCTRYEALHPLRGAAPEQKGCNAYGSGAAHPATRTNAESARRPPTRTRPRKLALPGPSAFSDHQPAFNNRRSVVTNHQSPISGQQPLHNHQSTISQRSTSRRRGRPRR